MKQVDPQKIQTIKDWLGTGSINIFGMPFAGKDTQGNYLAKLFDAPLLGSGDILRKSTNESVKKIIGGGVLAPTDQFLSIVMPVLAQSEFKGRPLILSSVGRWFGEQIPVMQSASDAGHPFKAVIFLKLSEEQVQARWEKAHEVGDREVREDDAHGKLDTRLEEFRNKTQAVIDYYREQGLLIEIDGDQSPEDVHTEIIDQLYERALL